MGDFLWFLDFLDFLVFLVYLDFMENLVYPGISCLRCLKKQVFILLFSRLALSLEKIGCGSVNFQDRSAIISSPPSSSERSGEGEGGDEMR